ncbi:hypothetical protein Fot_14526 [Forsythia ovata]|uniref:Uncharacterized protein n=1 Tax=Forsythia ovata TaxID=205694 RepID=A0ABD1W6K5_9LAMI
MKKMVPRDLPKLPFTSSLPPLLENCQKNCSTLSQNSAPALLVTPIVFNEEEKQQNYFSYFNEDILEKEVKDSENKDITPLLRRSIVMDSHSDENVSDIAPMLDLYSFQELHINLRPKAMEE